MESLHQRGGEPVTSKSPSESSETRVHQPQPLATARLHAVLIWPTSDELCLRFLMIGGEKTNNVTYENYMKLSSSVSINTSFTGAPPNTFGYIASVAAFTLKWQS